MPANSIIRLQKSDIVGSSRMLTKAFLDDPLLIYFFPDLRQREEKSVSFFKLLVTYGVYYGEPEATSSALEGIAIWLYYDNTDVSPWRFIRSGAMSMALKAGTMATGKMLIFGRHVSSVHKRHAPFRHCYLQTLGVNPASQGKGYASMLLRKKFDDLNRYRIPCYLDTQTERNLKIYEHFGFKVVEEFRVPGTTFKTWAMLRAPVS